MSFEDDSTLLRLRVAQKALQLPLKFFFFSFLPCCRCFSNGLAKVICIFFSYNCFRHVWPGSDLLIWHVTRSHDKIIPFISTTTVPIATKLGRMVTYLEQLSPVKLFDPLVMWSYKITWQTKTIITPLPQCLYGHQTWQVGDLFWRNAIHIVTWPLFWWSCLITRQFEKFISPFSHDLWPLNLAMCWLRGGGSVCKRLNRHRLLVYLYTNSRIKSINTLQEKGGTCSCKLNCRTKIFANINT